MGGIHGYACRPIYHYVLTVFFAWFQRQIVAIDEYAYAGIDFRGDPHLDLPEGAQSGAIGKNVLTIFFIF